MWNAIFDDPLGTIHKIPGKMNSRGVRRSASLIEPGMRYYTDNMLKRCRKNKYIYNSYIFNIIGGICFFAVLFTLLWYCRREKEEKDKNKDKIQEQKEIVLLDTIKKMRVYDQKRKSEMISNIPFESELHYEDKLFM